MLMETGCYRKWLIGLTGLSLFLTPIEAKTVDLTKVLEKSELKTYVPENLNLFQQRGENAFFWDNSAAPEEIPESAIITRKPYLQFRPGARVAAERHTADGLVIYNKTYTFDEKSRRVVLPPQGLRPNIVLLGCSFTLGTGLNDNETFPAQLAGLRKDFNIYNLGIYGAGANDVLDDLNSFQRFSDIPSTGGYAVYTAVYDHIERSLCTLNCYRSTYRGWVPMKSDYELADGAMVRRGSFEENRPVRNAVFKVLAGLSFLDGMNIPPRLTDAQIEHYVLMIREMKKITEEKLKMKFYFNFYPGNYGNWARIVPYLNKYAISYFDYSAIDLKEISGGRHAIILDGHPGRLGAFLFANLLHHSLP